MNFVLLATLIGIASYQITSVCILKTTPDSLNNEISTIIATRASITTIISPLPLLIESII
jgi:hypothetical protein